MPVPEPPVRSDDSIPLEEDLEDYTTLNGAYNKYLNLEDE